jgi:hypothetical protein
MATSDPVVDGWVIGEEVPCSTLVAGCDELFSLARTDLDHRNPGHAPDVRATLHREGVWVNDQGQKIRWTRSGSCCLVVRFEFADGPAAAIGVGQPGISPDDVAFDYGPIADPALEH